MRQADRERAKMLDAGLQSLSTQVPLLGVADPAARASLVRQMIDSLHRVEFVRRIGERPVDGRRLDPTTELFDPIRAAHLLLKAGDIDEAAWLIFLATHFGFHRKYGWELTRRVYGRLGQGPNWTWSRASADLPSFRGWFEANYKQLAGVPFGNHRKYESIRADIENNLADTVESYVRWVGPNRGFRLMVDDLSTAGVTSKALFDILYRSCPVVQFGRTGKFDFLTMIGKLGILPIEPPLPYLQGASGPVRGAKLLLANNANAKIPTPLLSARLVDIGGALGLGMQVMEDSLCNWQKSQFKYVPFRG